MFVSSVVGSAALHHADSVRLPWGVQRVVLQRHRKSRREQIRHRWEWVLTFFHLTFMSYVWIEMTVFSCSKQTQRHKHLETCTCLTLTKKKPNRPLLWTGVTWLAVMQEHNFNRNNNFTLTSYWVVSIWFFTLINLSPSHFILTRLTLMRFIPIRFIGIHDGLLCFMIYILQTDSFKSDSFFYFDSFRSDSLNFTLIRLILIWFFFFTVNHLNLIPFWFGPFPSDSFSSIHCTLIHLTP